MSASVEHESEILLGNKQLLAVFAVVAILLAVAFTGGYMLGKGSAEKKTAAGESQASNESASALVQRTVTPEDSSTRTDTAAKPEPPAPAPTAAPVEEMKPDVHPEPVAAAPVVKHISPDNSRPLGTPRPPEGTPKPGQTYVQIAALAHTEAVAMAEVLRKQNFAARVAPKPGSTTVYRVLVGPTRDAAEINATKDALRKIGFHDMIVQRY